MSLRRFLLVSGAIAAAGSSSAAWAQGAEASPPAGGSSAALEEIVVTARRREENLQTTPVAITAVSSETLEARNAVTLAKISQIAPSLVLYQTSGSLGAAGSYMRGIGYAENTPGQDSPIGYYVDGVALGRVSTSMMQLVEPQRVEVLRGPQGTLFGRNTTGGAILVSTHVPSDEFSGRVKASYGTYNNASFQARIDTGLIGDSGIKASLAYQHRQQDGSEDIAGQPRNLDPGAEKDDAYWFKAMGEWGKLTATFSADYSEVSGVPVNLQIVDATAAVRNFVALSPTYGGGGYVISQTPQYNIANGASGGLQRVWNQGLSLTLNYQLSDHLAIKSISSLRAYKRHDPSAYGPADLRGNVGTAAAPRIISFNGLYTLTDRYQSQRQRSQEVQILGDVGDFDYVAGVYYFKEGVWDFGVTRLPFVLGTGLTAVDSNSPRLFSVDSKSVAGFGQLNWRPSFLDKKLELSGGVRWTKDTRDFAQVLPLVRSANLETKNTSFLASANYQWTSDIMTYARFATGYRAGGFSPRAATGASTVFQPEKIKSWEAGFKAEAFDRRLRINGAAFYNKYRDLQVAQFQPPGATSAGGNATVNANATYKGFELEAEAVPVDGLTLNASVGYVDPKYTSYPRALEGGAVSPGCTPILSSAGATVGQDCGAIASFQYFPKTTVSAGVSYVFPKVSYGEWSIRADYAYKSHIASGTFNLPSSPFQDSIDQKAYGLLSAKITLADIPLTGNARGQLGLYGENLTDEKYSLQGIDFSYMASKTFGERRTFGVEGKVDF